MSRDRTVPKRVSKNRENLQAFFRESPSTMTAVDAEFFLKTLKLARKNPELVEKVLGFCRRYKQTADEITLEDVQECRNFFVVKSVLES